MNKKAFIGLSVVIDLIIVLIIIAAAVETHKNKKESSSTDTDKVAMESVKDSSGESSSEKTRESSKESSSGKSSDSQKASDDPTEAPTEAPVSPTEAPAAPTSVPMAAEGKMVVSVRYDGMEASANAVTGIMDITNNGTPVQLKDLKIDFYLTKNGKALVFECYHAALNTSNGSYQGLNSVSGSFSDASGTDADTLMTISFGDAQTFGTGDKLTVNFCAHSSDWTQMTTTDDWSVKDPGNIVIRSASGVICGKAPQ